MIYNIELLESNKRDKYKYFPHQIQDINGFFRAEDYDGAINCSWGRYGQATEERQRARRER